MNDKVRVLDFGGMPLNTTDIDQARLNIEDKLRSNPFQWNGQFSPQFIEAMLLRYAPAGGLILDPFAGSGTVLYEACRLGMSALGIDVNPAAFQIGSLYRFANMDMDERERNLAILGKTLAPWMHGTSSFLEQGDKEQPRISAREKLLELRRDETDAFRRILLDAMMLFMDISKDGTPRRDLGSVWKILKRVIGTLPVSTHAINMVNGDARQIALPPRSVDLVLTSPPYINVFNYHQHYRVSTETLGWDVLAVSKSEIGANRKHRSNRFLTVIQYCLDIMQVLIELARVCKPGGRIIFVVGRESSVRGVSISNGGIVADLAARSGCLQLAMRQERVFKNRFGMMIFEDILHLAPTGTPCVPDPLAAALQTAGIALVRALAAAPTGEVRKDVTQALEQANAVQPSPLYRR